MSRRIIPILMAIVVACVPLGSLAFAGEQATNQQLASASTCAHKWSGWEVEYAPTCGEAGSAARICRKCGEFQDKVLKATGKHKWKLAKQVAATKFKAGQKAYRCSICDATKTSKIAKLKQTKTDKDVVAAVKAYLIRTKKYDVPGMLKCFVKQPKDYFFLHKKTIAAACRRYNKKHLEWEMLSVTSKPKAATVKVKVTYPDGYRTFTKAFRKYDRWYENRYYQGRQPSLSEARDYHDKVTGKWIKMLGMDKSDKVLTFAMKKVDARWLISRATFNIQNTANCGFEEAYRDHYDE